MTRAFPPRRILVLFLLFPRHRKRIRLSSDRIYADGILLRYFLVPGRAMLAGYSSREERDGEKSASRSNKSEFAEITRAARPSGEFEGKKERDFFLDCIGLYILCIYAYLTR